VNSGVGAVDMAVGERVFRDVEGESFYAKIAEWGECPNEDRWLSGCEEPGAWLVDILVPLLIFRGD
jgi:hypothetical protein